jgi:hypothetical protein
LLFSGYELFPLLTDILIDTVCARDRGLHKVKNVCRQIQMRAGKLKHKPANRLGPFIFGELKQFGQSLRGEKNSSLISFFQTVTIPDTHSIIL